MIVSSGIDSLNGGNGIDVYKIDGGNLSSSSETYIGDEDGKFFLDFDGISGTSRALYIDPAPESIGGAYWMQLAGSHTNITHLAPSGTPSGEWAPGYVFWNDAAFVTVQTKEPEVENTDDNFSVYFADDRITVTMFSGPQIYLTGFSDLPGLKELVNSGLLSFNTTNHLWSFDLSDYVEDPSNGGSGGGSNSVSGQSGQADSLGIPSDAAASFSVNNFSYSEGDRLEISAYDAALTNLAALSVTNSGGNAQFILPATGGNPAVAVTVAGLSAAAMNASYFLSNTLDYGAGSTLTGSDNASLPDTVDGTFGNDTIYANSGHDSATGGTGNDVAYGWHGNDTLKGGYGADSLNGDQDNDQLYGDSGNDHLFGYTGLDTVYGGDGNDYIEGEADADQLRGDKGNDTIYGGAAYPSGQGRLAARSGCSSCWCWFVTTGARSGAMSGDGFSRRYTMVAETRRRWGDAEKQAIVAEAARPGTNISAVARRHGIKPSLLFRWRRMAQEAAEPQSAGPVFLPVAVTNGKASGEDAASGDLAPASDAAVHCLADSRIEIELGNGRLVRVGAGVDIGALKRVLDLLDGPATTGAAPRRKRFS